MGGCLFRVSFPHPLSSFAPSLRRSVCALFVLLATAAWSAAASAPDWLYPVLAVDPAKWGETEHTLRLLDYQRTEYTGRDRVRTVIRVASRLLADDGRPQLRAQFVYNSDTMRIRSARAWIVSANQKKTRSFGRDEFQDVARSTQKLFWNATRMIYHYPTENVEVGGVYAWEFEVEGDAGFFDTNRDFLPDQPTRRSVFEVVPVAGSKLEWHATSALIPAPQTLGASGGLRWQMEQLLPVPEDEPTDFIANPLRVSVRCAATGTAAGRLGSWEEFSRTVAEIVEPRMAVEATIRAKAAALTANGASRWDRVRALSEFVQRDVSYLSMTLEKDSVAGYRPRPAAECLRNLYGDCKDKASLLAAMLRAIDDRGYLVLVFSGNPRVVPRDWPSACFNHAIAAIPADAETPAHWPVVETATLGRLVIFDATDPFTPLGVLPRSDQGGHALVVAAGGAELVTLPGESHSASGIHREFTGTLRPQGALEVKGTERRLGSAGAARQASRATLREEQFGNLVQGRLRALLPLMRDFKWKEHWDAPSSTHQLELEFAVDKYARPIGTERLMFSPLVPEPWMQLNSWKVEHEGTSWFHGLRLQDTMRLTLPEGFDLEELPKPLAIDDAKLAYRITYRMEGRTVVTERQVVMPEQFQDRATYEAFRQLVQRAQEQERRPVILKRTAAAVARP